MNDRLKKLHLIFSWNPCSK